MQEVVLHEENPKVLKCKIFLDIFLFFSTWLEAADDNGDGVEWELSSKLVLEKMKYMSSNIQKFLNKLQVGFRAFLFYWI